MKYFDYFMLVAAYVYVEANNNMNQYKEYSLEDFVLDARFQKWVRHEHQSESAFWQSFINENPLLQNDILQAKVLLKSVYRHYNSDINDSEIDVEIQELLSKVRLTKLSEDAVPVQVLKKNIFKRNSLFWAAASIILCLSLGWLYQSNQSGKSDYERLTVTKQLREERNDSKKNKAITLPDGSKIILTPYSKISFPEQFLSEKRVVYLSGEATFDVSKDPKRPFLVYANQLVTKVLGTSFTINARNAANKTTVEVKEGKVSVFRQTDFSEVKDQNALKTKGMVITANQKVVYEKETANMLKTISDRPEIVPGEESSFNFTNVPASQVLSELKEAYQVDIIFDKELLGDCPVTASLEHQSLFEKLDIICEVIEASYEMLDGKIVVYSRGCKN
ncbi:FecR family protein [Dyadobacter sp. CY312]|uniref:FecR family protein n=1 Tax=Dyadobacter sp. CY312 TaxID=2907303 RepID=UPI001F28ABFB|nr:FecR family protein [Dyadobacter sp. CY312]MCE7039715.1 FecR domain-containing protein [Dyadobacter sp. CY312]